MCEEWIWISTFGAITVYFVYLLVFVAEEDRLSNDTLKTFAFMSLMFAFLAAVNRHQRKTEATSNKKSDYASKEKAQLLNQHLKASVRYAMVAEEQRRALNTIQRRSDRRIERKDGGSTTPLSQC